MEEIIKTILLEHGKSSFLIDLVKHENGKLYVAIQQIIRDDFENFQTQTIKINPAILVKIIETLTIYKNELPKDIIEERKLPKTSEEKKEEEIIRRYFKGVEIEDLAIQFDRSANVIKQILSNNRIPIVSNKMPKNYKHWYWKRKRKF